MSVPVRLGADLDPCAARGPRAAARPADRGHPLGEGAQLLEVGRGCVIALTLGSGACPIPSAASTCAATRSPAHRRRCAGRWPRPRWATTGSATTPPSPRLEAAFAERVGKEASLFVPSGTMANQIALRLLGAARHRRAGGAPPARGRAGGGGGRPQRRRPAGGARRRRRHDRPGRGGALGGRRPRRAGPSRRRCSSRTPTARSAAGCGRSSASSAVAAVGLPVHLDGARLWNAAVASGTDGRRAGRGRHHRHLLRVEGPRRAGRFAARRPGRPDRAGRGSSASGSAGACARSGILAAAGLVALDRVDRLADDHERARRLAKAAADALAGRRRRGARRDQHRPHHRRRPAARCSPTSREHGVLAVPGSADHRPARHPRRRRRRRHRPGRSRRWSPRRDRGHDAGASAGGVRPPRRPRGGVRRHARPLGRARDARCTW